MGIHAALAAVAVPLAVHEIRARGARTSYALPAPTLVAAEPVPQVELPLPERTDAFVELPPEPAPATDLGFEDPVDDEQRERVAATVFCPDPLAQNARLRPSRGRRGAGVGESGEGGGGAPGAAAVAPAAASAQAPAVAPPPAGPTRPPALVEHVAPSYPRRARELGVEGTVRLRVVVEADARVSAVEIVTSSGSDLLDEAAAEAARDWTFRPALDEGTPVRATLDLPPVRFRLTSH